MKEMRLAPLIVAVAVTVALPACGATADPGRPEPAPGKAPASSTYRDGGAAFSISLPRFPIASAGVRDAAGAVRVGWVHLATFTAIAAEGEGPDRTVCHEMVSVLNSPMNAAAFRSYLARECARGGSNLASTRELTVSGKPAILASLEPKGGDGGRFLVLGVLGDSMTFEVACVAPASRFATLEAALQASIDSFRLDASGGAHDDARSIYRDALYGFAIEPVSVPTPLAGWIVKFEAPPTASGSRTYLEVTVAPPDTREASRERLYKLYAAPDGSVSSATDVTVSGREALRSACELKSGGRLTTEKHDRRILGLSVFDRAHAIHVAAACSKDEFATRGDELLRCLDSFEMLEK
jgi:hypothetical protein